MDHTNGYLEILVKLYEKIEKEEFENIEQAAELMKDAVKKDRLISVFGGGGHTTLAVGEMFFRAGGLCNINPCTESALTVFNQAGKFMSYERCVNYGRHIMDYYDLHKNDVLIIFHNIGTNAVTIDAAQEAKEHGAKIIAVSSLEWQNSIPQDSPLRHPSHKNLFELADISIDDHVPVGDAVITLDGLGTPVGPVSNLLDFYIAHRLEMECIKKCLNEGVTPPVWYSANVPGGDECNRNYIKKYSPRVKML